MSFQAFSLYEHARKLEEVSSFINLMSSSLRDCGLYLNRQALSGVGASCLVENMHHALAGPVHGSDVSVCFQLTPGLTSVTFIFLQVLMIVIVFLVSSGRFAG